MRKTKFIQTKNKSKSINNRNIVNGYYFDKKIVYYIAVPAMIIIILASFVLFGLIIGKRSILKQIESLNQQMAAQVTPTPLQTPTSTPTHTPTVQPTETPEPTPTPTPEETEEKNYFGRLGGTNDGGATYMGRITFIGGEAANKLNFYFDSITDENTWYKSSNHGAYLNDDLYEVDGTSYSLNDWIITQQPEIMLFAFCGHNSGSRGWEADQFIDEYEKFILEIKSGISVDMPHMIIMSVFPVTSKYEEEDTHYKQSNDRIREINRGLEKFARNNECYYLDVNGILRGDDSALKEEYADYNGFDLNKTGYKAVYSYIKTHQVLH